MNKYPIIAAFVGIVGIVGTVFAMSDRFIAKATFMEFKERVIHRLDRMETKLDVIIQAQNKN